jgi:hypothetical protein
MCHNRCAPAGKKRLDLEFLGLSSLIPPTKHKQLGQQPGLSLPKKNGRDEQAKEESSRLLQFHFPFFLLSTL